MCAVVRLQRGGEVFSCHLRVMSAQGPDEAASVNERNSLGFARTAAAARPCAARADQCDRRFRRHSLREPASAD